MRVRGYTAGTPCWATLAGSGSTDFYAGLFGWGCDGSRFTLEGRAVAGLSSWRDAPATWLVSVATADLAVTHKLVVRAGGGPALQGGLFADPAGTVFGVRTVADDPLGAEVSHEPGAVCWYELAAHDLSIADDFYGEVFGWRVLEAERHFAFRHHGDPVAGLVPFRADLPAAWSVCFMVDSYATACERAVELGGSVIATSHAGAWVADPAGAHFAVVESGSVKL
jgi:predicted enzyme related to lactoylglutathione lyase